MSEVSKINLPTEIIAGSIDDLTPVKFADYLATNISNAQEHVIQGGDHFLQLQFHKQVNAAIDQFLARIK